MFGTHIRPQTGIQGVATMFSTFIITNNLRSIRGRWSEFIDKSKMSLKDFTE